VFKLCPLIGYIPIGPFPDKEKPEQEMSSVAPANVSQETPLSVFLIFTLFAFWISDLIHRPGLDLFFNSKSETTTLQLPVG